MLQVGIYRPRLLISLIVPVLLLVSWQAWSVFGSDNALFASPAKVWSALLSVIRRGTLVDALLSSLGRAFAGFAAGAAIGLALGILNGLSAVSDRLTDTTLKMIHSVPSLAVVPLFIIWFGIGEISKILLIAFAISTIVYISTVQAIKNTDPRLKEMARTYRLNRWQQITEVVLPGAIPGILDGIRYAMSVTWFVLIAAETIGTDSGIGFMAALARDYLQTGLVFLCVLIYAALGLLSDALIRLLRRYLLRWNPSHTNAF